VNEDGADPGFETVRTTLESALKPPFAVTFSSTQADDGKTALAAGTARAFAAAGFRTIVVDAHPGFPGVAPALGIAELALPVTLDAAKLAPVQVAPNLEAVSVGSHKLVDGIAPAKIQQFVRDVRARYDVTIFDACDLFYDPLAVQCAAACDGVVLAVRYARNPDEDDARAIGALEKNGARIIGTVTTSYPGPLARALRTLIKFS
jgi:Mrp family chromosome partitioning ATPase